MTHCDHDPRIRVEEDDCGFIVTEYGDSSDYWTHRCPTIEAAARTVRALGFEPSHGAVAWCIGAPTSEEPEPAPTSRPTRLADARALIGHKVRSFSFVETWDFPDPADTSANPAPTHTTGRDLVGERACYVEGVVESIEAKGDFVGGCYRYAIRVSRQVSRGEETDRRLGGLVFPPINGTPNSLGGVQNGVELVAPEAAEAAALIIQEMDRATRKHGPNSTHRAVARQQAEIILSCLGFAWSHAEQRAVPRHSEGA